MSTPGNHGQYDFNNPLASQASPQGAVPTPGYYGAGFGPMGVKPKSKLIALALCFFLGYFGIHHFYVGNKGPGIAQLVCSVVGFALSLVLIGFFFLAIVGVWILVDLVLIALGSGYFSHDSNGLELTWDL
ncbi:TM2 domain-containing protein [Corynebacterium tapiri]|uniref:TM2 domain-containing protein n=1 Tax=Corynebacterium tapiri TaxID=1448266 RepID=A0A5C4U622_9CORY|nr:TM2 domain-containing protein [Corynebacterium tapiri]TNL99846.1 TM2 domain-containing protein [Corynebacterium tapiri]